MPESTSSAVECPVCGVAFDPTEAGGWCTNPDCGEWQYIGEEVPEPASGGGVASEVAAPTLSRSTGETDETEGGEAGANDPDDLAAVDTGADGSAPDEPAGDGSAPDEPAGDGSAPDEPAGDGSAPDESATEDPSPRDWGSENSGPTPAIRRIPTEPTGEEVAIEDADDPAFDEAPDGEEASCPSCGTAVDSDANFCVSCGADLTDEGDEPTLEVCPTCDTDVDADASFCPSCGEDLAARREELDEGSVRSRRPAGDDTADGSPESLVLLCRGQEIAVADDDTVGREVRRVITETGGEEDQAVRVHREHVRFVREADRFYVVDLGDNPTRLNGTRLSKGDREPVAPGDEIELSGVATLAVESP